MAIRVSESWLKSITAKGAKVGKCKPAGARDKLETKLAALIKLDGLPDPVREYRFHTDRKWRLDFAWPAEKVAVEVHGAVFAQGRHTRGVGFRNDCEKRNAANIAGWMLLEFTDKEIKNGHALETIRSALAIRRLDDLKHAVNRV